MTKTLCMLKVESQAANKSESNQTKTVLRATKKSLPEWRSSAEIVKSITEKRIVEEKNAGCKKDLYNATDNMRETSKKSKYLA